MNVYELSTSASAPPTYHPDLAHLKAVNRLLPASGRVYVRIRLLDVDFDKGAIVRLLNGTYPTFTVKRQWHLSPRGGMVEDPVSEDA